MENNNNNNSKIDSNMDDNNNNAFTVTDSRNEKILWACVGRIDQKEATKIKDPLSATTILAEAGEDVFDGAVTTAAQGILASAVTPGYEYYTLKHAASQQELKTLGIKIKAVKFHIHDHSVPANKKIWVFAAVYQQPKEMRGIINHHNKNNNNNSDVQLQVQLFLEKVVGLTELYREDVDNETWRYGSTLACQAEFAPTLLQRMQEVTYMGQLAQLHDSLQNTKDIMNQNIDNLLQIQDNQLTTLQDESTQLQQMSSVFKKNTQRVRRAQMMQNAKHGIILGTAATTGLAVCIVPPLIAFL